MLTDIKCKNTKCTSGKLLKLADGGGLYLWIYADGRKYWRLRYWLAGKEKSLSLGVYPAISLKEARKRRDAERRHLENKLDPAAERRAEKLRRHLSASNSFEAVAREWHAKFRSAWTPDHAASLLRRLELNIFPVIGRRPISEIDPLELLATVRPIENRGAYDLAHRVLQVCGKVFRYGVLTGRCPRDIAADLRGALAPAPKQHQPAVRPEELPELLRAIAKYEEIGDRQTRLALELMALTFTRTSEMIGALRVEFDLDAAMWSIPAERMKMKAPHLVPLSRQAIAIVRELIALGGDSALLFPGRNRNRPISNNTMLFALYRLGYKGRMTGHGFRAVASTILNEQGYRSDVIERQLAHTERDEVRGAYNRAEYMPERTTMMQQWADHLDALRAGAKVMPMKRRVSAGARA